MPKHLSFTYAFILHDVFHANHIRFAQDETKEYSMF